MIKKLLTLIISSYFMVISSNAMDRPPTLEQLAQRGEEGAIDALLSNPEGTFSYEEGLSALNAAINGGHVSIIPKLLDFLSGFEFCTADSDDFTMAQEVTDVAIECASNFKNEAVAVSMLEEIFKYPSLPIASKDGSHNAFANAITYRHSKVIHILRESHKLITPNRILIILACKHNYPDLSINLLKSMTNKKLLQKSSCHTLCAAAEKNKVEYLNALLAEPEITVYLSAQNLTDIGQAVSANQDISDTDKAAIKKTLEALAYNKGWCIIF